MTAFESDEIPPNRASEDGADEGYGYKQAARASAIGTTSLRHVSLPFLALVHPARLLPSGIGFWNLPFAPFCPARS